MSDIQHHDAGFEVLIRSSKTDQEAQGQSVAIRREPESPYCPVAAIESWINAAGITSGAIFRQMSKGDGIRENGLKPESVAYIVKHYAKRLGIDSSAVAGHSLRSGFLTSAARNGASPFKMAEVSRHKSLQTLQAYVRDADKFEQHAGEGLLQRQELEGATQER